MKMKTTFFNQKNRSPRCGWIGLLLLCLTFFSQNVHAQSCSLACNGTTQVSLNSDCNSEVTPSMIINGAMSSCPDGEFKVVVTDLAGVEIPTSPFVTDAEIGKQLKVAVIDTSIANGNECWGYIVVEDKIAPTITCVADTTLKCYQMAIADSLVVTASDNCSDVTIEVTAETTTVNDCTVATGLPDSVLMMVSRTYRAVDAQGMVSQECTVNFTVTRLDSLEEITQPASLLKANSTSLDCAGGYATLPNGHPSPVAVGGLPGTGVPTLDGIPLYPSDGQFCNLLVTYDDTRLPAVQCVEKIMRRWDVFEWSCSSVQRMVSYTQMIEIEDTQAPTFDCPAPVIASTSGYECEGYVLLPALENLEDNCSNTIRVDVLYEGGILQNQNGGLAAIPVGNSVVTYIAYDECGKSSSCEISVLVEDATPPVAVCDQNTVVALTNGGEAYVDAFVFDDGSYDDCALESYVVRRMPDANGQINCMPCERPQFEEFTYLGEHNGNFYYLSRWAKNARVAYRYAEAFGAYVYSANNRAEQEAVNGFVASITSADSYYIGLSRAQGSSVFRWDDGSTSTYRNFASANVIEDGEDYVLVDANTGDWSTVNGDTLNHRFIVEVENPCSYSQYAEFCCEDLSGNPHQVQFRAIDAQGNWNECMVNVTVQDKIRPQLTCPPDMTVDCEFAYDPLNLSAAFGTPIATGNCSPLMEMDSITELNQCNIGTITRIFTIMDGNGNPAVTCEQLITFDNQQPFDFQNDVDFPDDVTMTGCSDPDSDMFLPAATGVPVFRNADACDLLGYNYDDQVFRFNNNSSDPSCFKILRTFTVIDWCQAGNGFTIPQVSFTQTIKVVDENEPFFTTTCDPVRQCTFDSDCAEGSITLTQTAADSVCTEELSWRAVVNPFKSSSAADDIEITGTGNTATITRTFPVGDHSITWTFIDRCGNQVTCLQDFSIANCKAPTPYAFTDLATDLMPIDDNNDGIVDGGMVELWASDFDAGSFHPCPGYDVLVSFSPNVLDTGILFTCLDTGDAPLQLWATAIDADGEFVLDTAGNMLQAWIDLTVDIQDNMNACGGSTNRVAISGGVALESGQAIEETVIKLTQSGAELMSATTDLDGNYAFPTMDAGGSYMVQAVRDDAHDRGVSTLDLVLIQRHILGYSNLSSAYKMLAADVTNDRNVSGADVIELRKLILGVNSTFTDSDAWRFVDAAYQFPDQLDPWYESIPEEYMIASLDNSMDVDFTAIKVGDVNGSVAQDLDGRSAPINLVVESGVLSGDAIEMPIAIDRDMSVAGLQLALDFDAATTEILEITGVELSIAGADYRVIDGQVLISYAADFDTELSAGDVLFTVVYESTAASQKDAFAINDEALKSEIYDADYTQYALELRYAQEESGIVLYQNAPNPFMATTQVQIFMPEAQDVQLTVFDVTGKQIANYKRSLIAGMNTIEINKQDLSATGVLFYTLSANNFTATKRMIVLQ